VGAAHDDLLAAHLAKVEGMHGVAVFQHDVVGDIHNAVDGAQARAVQIFTHPQGRGRDAHILDDTRGITGTQVGCVHTHLHLVVNVAAGFGDRKLRGMKFRSQCGGGFTRDTKGAQAIRTVCENLKVHGIVVNAKNGADVAADGIILIKDEKPLVPDAGVQLLRHL